MSLPRNGTVAHIDGVDFDLPEEILAAMPTDPYELLDLARKITSLAIASRVTSLESEVSRLKLKLHESDSVITNLEEKVIQKQQAFQDTQLKLKNALEDNIKLMKERDTLSTTNKKLNRDLVKLESFKKQLMQSLNEEVSSTTEDSTNDRSVSKPYTAKDDGLNAKDSHKPPVVPSGARRDEGLKFSVAPSKTPSLSPTRQFSANTSPRKASGINASDKQNSFWFPSSQQSSAANSPPRSRTGKIDGKEFFRQARSRLSYEQFSAFLANIKELNAQKQTREETLRKAEEVFGVENNDLYHSFYNLLNRSNVN